MVAKARETAKTLGLTNIEFREGLAEALPIADGWADVVISNGAINLCTDKHLAERPSGKKEDRLAVRAAEHNAVLPCDGQEVSQTCNLLSCRTSWVLTPA